MDQKELQFLEARIVDSIRQCDNRNVPRFVGFLDATGASAAVTLAKREKARFMLFGGYQQAERAYFGVFPDWCEPDGAEFPIVKLRIVNRSDRELTHRDVLGALMSAGIERDTVGDILTSGKDPIVFVSEGVASHIEAHVDKIASAGVEIVRDTSDYLPISVGLEECSGTVASLRLDCVVAEISNCSRNRSVELIEGGLVAVNGLEALKITMEIRDGDTITVRRVGKFIIDDTSKLTKKGRIALKYRKYI